MNLFAPVGKYLITVDDTLSDVQATIMTDGDLISNNKIILSDVIKQQGGGSILQEAWLLQQDTGATGDLEKTATELYVFNNLDALGVLVSGDPFTLDGTTTIANVVYHKIFASGDWVTIKDGDNCYLVAKDINVLCKAKESTQYSLAYCWVTGGAPTFSNHTLTSRFVFEQCKTRE